MIRLGLVCSSGGAVLGAGFRLLRDAGYDPTMAVVTDRQCGAEQVCTKLGIPWTRIEQPCAVDFCVEAGNWLLDMQHMDWIALFFTRLVTKELYARAPCVNFHPSLLPAFRGFGALKQVLDTGARFVGATAHRVEELADAGAILAQVVAPVPTDATLADLERISFAQKVYLFLVMCESAARGEISGLFAGRPAFEGSQVSGWANPAIRDVALAEAFERFLSDEGIPWVR